MEKGKWAAAGVIAGAILGAATALLIAPSSGRESRQALASRTGELRQRAEGYVDNIRGRFRRDRDEEGEEAGSSSSGNRIQSQD